MGCEMMGKGLLLNAELVLTGNNIKRYIPMNIHSFHEKNKVLISLNPSFTLGLRTLERGERL